MSTVPNQPGERTSRGASHLLVSEVPTEALIACGASLFWGGSIPRILTPAAGDAKLSDGVNASITNTQNISPKITQNNFPNHMSLSAAPNFGQRDNRCALLGGHVRSGSSRIDRGCYPPPY